jgi:hypothetical protein
MLTTLAVCLLSLAPGVNPNDASSEMRLESGGISRELTRSRLQLELLRLDDDRPSLLGPIVGLSLAAAAGVVTIPYGVFIFVFMAEGGFGTLNGVTAVLWYMQVSFAVAAILMPIGGVIVAAKEIYRRLERGELLDAQKESLLKQLRDLGEDRPGLTPMTLPPRADGLLHDSRTVVARF